VEGRLDESVEALDRRDTSLDDIVSDGIPNPSCSTMSPSISSTFLDSSRGTTSSKLIPNPLCCAGSSRFLHAVALLCALLCKLGRRDGDAMIGEYSGRRSRSDSVDRRAR
jgi:hypothetical protein